MDCECIFPSEDLMTSGMGYLSCLILKNSKATSASEVVPRELSIWTILEHGLNAVVEVKSILEQPALKWKTKSLDRG